MKRIHVESLLLTALLTCGPCLWSAQETSATPAKPKAEAAAARPAPSSASALALQAPIQISPRTLPDQMAHRSRAAQGAAASKPAAPRKLQTAPKPKTATKGKVGPTGDLIPGTTSMYGYPDDLPAGTVRGNYRKVVRPTPFGNQVWWELIPPEDRKPAEAKPEEKKFPERKS